MQAPPNIHVPLDQRLAILQQADGQRRWSSLDDARVCAVCGRAITGRQIDITRDGHGRFLLRCPTDGCASTANDWLLSSEFAPEAQEAAVASQEFLLFGTDTWPVGAGTRRPAVG
jgi:hypothetical protein